jgi:chemotaxis response regulator CheB
MKTSKKAILWGHNDLLTKSMELFLTAGETWQVIKIPAVQGNACLLEQTRQLQPDVIILYAENYVEDPPLPMQLIQQQPNLRVIIVSLEENQIQIYSRQSIIVREAADLLSIIENRYFLGHPTSKEVEQEKGAVFPVKS